VVAEMIAVRRGSPDQWHELSKSIFLNPKLQAVTK
jgi:hypothetical protein